MRLILRSVSANNAAKPSSKREKLTWPTNSKLDHLRVLRPWDEDELDREVIPAARLLRLTRQAGRKLKPTSVAKRRAAPNAYNSHPGRKSSGMGRSPIEAHRSRRALAARATKIAGNAPSNASSTSSAKSWRKRRHRLAPKDARTVSSRWRLSKRTS